jgi:hypothetical protein
MPENIEERTAEQETIAPDKISYGFCSPTLVWLWLEAVSPFCIWLVVEPVYTTVLAHPGPVSPALLDPRG